MQREATAVKVRQNLGELLNQVQCRGDSVVVTKHGKPVAALVDYALYERIRRLSESFVALTDKLGQVNADVPTETADAEIDAAVRSVRRRVRRGRRFQAKTANLKDDLCHGN